MKKVSHKEKLKGTNQYSMDDRPHPEGVPEMAIVVMAGTSHPEIYLSDRLARILSQALKNSKILIINGNHHEEDSKNISWEKEYHEMKWMGAILENETKYSPIAALKELLTNKDLERAELEAVDNSDIPF